MRITTLTLFAAAIALTSTPSFADRATADACAAKLAPEAKLIYAEVIGSVVPGVQLEEVVRSKTRSLVIGGQVNRGQAEPSARAAGACLKQAL